MIQTIRKAWGIPELRKKIVFTLLILLIFRVGNAIPTPYINTELLGAYIDSTGGSLLSLYNVMSGGAFAQATVFALGVQPYINSSIIIQLLTIAIPALERLARDGGEAGKKKIASITRYATVAIALLQAFGYYMICKNYGILEQSGIWPALVIIVTLVAGSSFVMWLGEQVNEFGIGNGISMILFANIVASFPNTLVRIFKLIFNTNKNLPDLVNSGYTVTHPNLWWIGTIIGVLGLVMCVALIAFMVFMTNSERRLPVQYAKRVVGRKMYGGQNTTLPLKLNMTGVMPIIFASSIVSIPATISMFTGHQNATSGFWGWSNGFNQFNWLYILVFGLLLVAFAYFYVAISFNPVEVANNLKKNGGSIPGIRSGKPTSDYISRVLSRVTFIGAICLLIIACLPMILGCIGNAAGTGVSGSTTTYNWSYALTYFSFSGNSLLIVVGVVLETVRAIEAQMTMRNFKGFLE